MLAFCLAQSGGVAGAEGLGSDNAQRQTILDQCAKQLGFSDPGCTCIADGAEVQLSEAQRALLIAQITRDTPDIDRLTARLTPSERAIVTNFLHSAPGICADR